MKKLTVYILLLFVSYTINAQHKADFVELIWENKTSKELSSFEVILTDETSVYALYDNGEYYIHKYDKSLNLQKSVKFDAETAYYSNFKVIELDNNIYVITMNYSDKMGQYSVEIKKLNQRIFRLETIKRLQPFKFASKKTKEIFKHNNPLEFRISKDKSKIGILFRVQEKNFSKFIVFDNKFNKLFERKPNFSQTKVNVFEDWRIDNEGNAYQIIAEVDDSKEAKKAKDKTNFKYYIQVIGIKKSNDIKYKISVNNFFYKNLLIELDKKNNIYFAGLYSKTGMFTLSGYYSGKINISKKQIVNQKFEDFKIDFYTANFPKSRLKSVVDNPNSKSSFFGRLMYYYQIDKMILKENGEIILPIEQMAINDTEYDLKGDVDVSGVHYDTRYYYTDIIVLNLNENGDLKWVKKIKRLFRSFYDNSYSLIQKGENLYFIYYDFLENYGITKDDKLYNPWATINYNTGDRVVSISRIDKNGEEKKEYICKVPLQSVWLRLTFINKFEGKELFVTGFDQRSFGKRNCILGKLILK